MSKSKNSKSVKRPATSKTVPLTAPAQRAEPSQPVGTAPAGEQAANTKAKTQAASAAKLASDKPLAQVAAKSPARERPSGLSAAHGVLVKAGKAMTVGDITQTILSRKLWVTGGRTPGATIAAAIMREIKLKGDSSRFARAGRGLFEARTTVAAAGPKAISSKPGRAKAAVTASK